MVLQVLKELVGRDSLFLEVRDQAADADRQRFLVGIQERGADHAAGDFAHDLDDDAFVVLDLETLLDQGRIDEVDFLDRQRHVLRRQFLLDIGAAGQQRVDAVGHDDHVGVDFTVHAVGADAVDLAVGVAQQFGDGGFADDEGAGFPDLLVEPAVELGTDDRVAVRLLAVEAVGPVIGPDIAVVAQQPDPLFDDMPLAEIGDDLFQGVGVHDGALDVLGAGIFAALDLQNLQAGFGQGIRRRVAGRTGADDDGIEFFNHVRHSSGGGQLALRLTRRRWRNCSVRAGRICSASPTMP